MFCLLEIDQKTFEYINEYLREWREHHDLTQLDRRITAQEIEQHIRLHGKQEQKTTEAVVWIQHNGRSFRAYLNTIKLVLLLWSLTHDSTEEFTWEEFCAIREKVNMVKEELLDTLMIEKINTSSMF